MKRSGNGASLGNRMPINCDADSFSLGIRGIDEVFLTIQGERHDLWRAVDQDGNILDILRAAPAGQEGREDVLPQAAQTRLLAGHLS